MEEDKKFSEVNGESQDSVIKKNSKSRKKVKKQKSFTTGVLVGSFIMMVAAFIAIFCMHMVYENDVQQIAQLYQQTMTDETNISTRIGTKMNKIEDLIQMYYYEDVDLDMMDESVYKAIASSLGDEYSVYYNEEEYAQLMQSTTGQFKGIGVVVTENEEGGALVLQTYEGGSAHEAGIQSYDIICGVNGEDVSDMDVSVITAKIKSSENDMVHIKTYRESTNSYLEYDLELREVSIPTISYEMMEDNIGYIYISQFSSVTLQQFEHAIVDLKNQGVEGLVIDLRNNGGGNLVTTTEMLDLLMPEGIITYTKGKDGTGTEYTSDAEQLIQVPMAILVNGNSASASEVFAGALKDYELATLVGERTFGKGVVQTLNALGDGTALKLTISRYYTPSGVCIHDVGIEPDVIIELDTEALQKEDATVADDNQLQEALRIVREQM